MTPVHRIEPTDDLPCASVHRGQKPEVLLIAFTGFAGRLDVEAFEFLGLAGQLECSRVLLRDPSNRCYLAGVEGIASSLPTLLDYLRTQQAALAPQQTMVIGNSGGSFAALLFGHLLEADWVHAFSPFTNFAPDHLRRHAAASEGARDMLRHVSALGPSLLPYLDLREVLANGNGRTRFNLHVCQQSEKDLERAQYLGATPGVTVLGYPCNHHGVARVMARARLLKVALAAENQDDVAGALARAAQAQGGSPT